MVGLVTFDIFNFCKVPEKRTHQVQLESHPTLKQVLFLKKEFFVEVINSTISTSSELHPIYCANTSPVEIDHVRNNNASTEEIHDDVIDNVHVYFTYMTALYNPSITLYRVLSSMCYSLLTFYSKTTTGTYIKLGWSAYICDPINGLTILFILVNDEFQKQGIGSSMMQTLQFLCSKNLGTNHCLVWYTKLSSSYSNDLVKYYRNLDFHPTISSNYCLGHILPSSLVTELHNISPNAYHEDVEFLLETNNVIERMNTEKVLSIDGNIDIRMYTCEICGINTDNISAMVVCEHTLHGSMRVIVSGKRKRSVCGVTICQMCHSNFGCTESNKCPLHHEVHNVTTFEQQNDLNQRICEFKKSSIQLSSSHIEEQSQSIVTVSNNMMSFCKHCSLFNQCKYVNDNNWLYFTTMKLNNSSEYQYLYNNSYDMEHMDWMIRNNLCEIQECPFSGPMKLKHPLCFRFNSGKPSSLLTNRLFGIRNVEGHGDCGVLCIMYAFLSTSTDIRHEIEVHSREYVKNHWISEFLVETDISITSVQDIRKMLFYTKLDDSERMPYLAMKSNETSYIFDSVEKAKEEDKLTAEFYHNLQVQYNLIVTSKSDESAKSKTMMEQLKGLQSLLLHTSEKYSSDDVYWLTDVDFFNVSVFTNGLVGAICVKDTNDPNENDKGDFIHDFGYRKYFEKPILQSCKYFFIVRFVGGQHYDILKDEIHQTSLFKTEFQHTNNTEAINVLYSCLPDKLKLELSGISPMKSWDEIYHLAKSTPKKPIPKEFFTHDVPNWDKWYSANIDMSHNIFQMVEKSFNWTMPDDKHYKAKQGLLQSTTITSESLTMPVLGNKADRQLIQKKPGTLIKVVLHSEKFDQECCIDLVGYVMFNDTMNQAVFYDINGLEIMSNRFQFITSESDTMNWYSYFLTDKWRIASLLDINKLKHKIAYMIFQDEVHLCGNLSFTMRKSIGMRIFDDFDDHFIEKCRIQARYSATSSHKTEFMIAYLFGKYSHGKARSIFKLMSNYRNDTVTSELVSRAFFGMQKCYKRKNIFHFILIPKESLKESIWKVTESLKTKSDMKNINQLMMKMKTDLKVSSTRNHYFLYTSFFCKHDFNSANIVLLKDIQLWSLVSGFVCNLDFFQKTLRKKQMIHKKLRDDIYNMSLVLRDHIGFGDEYHLLNFIEGIVAMRNVFGISNLIKDNQLPDEEFVDTTVTLNESESDEATTHETQQQKESKTITKCTVEKIPLGMSIEEYMLNQMGDMSTIDVVTSNGKPTYYFEYRKDIRFDFAHDERYHRPKVMEEYEQGLTAYPDSNDICLNSYTLSYKLSYKEVYGRLLGNDKLVPEGRFKELNDSLINAAIRTICHYAIQENRLGQNDNETEDSKDMIYPEVYVATTYLHRYFSKDHFDMNKAMRCFYQISRNENRDVNPGYFFANNVFLIPWNYHNTHWVLLFVDMNDKEFFIMDSSRNRALDNNIEHQMKLMIKFLCVLYNFEHREEAESEYVSVIEFKWIKDNGWLPKQTNAYDCGVFMLMNIFSTVSGDKNMYTQRDAQTFRFYLCAILADIVYREELDMKEYEQTLSSTSVSRTNDGRELTVSNVDENDETDSTKKQKNNTNEKDTSNQDTEESLVKNDSNLINVQDEFMEHEEDISTGVDMNNKETTKKKKRRGGRGRKKDGKKSQKKSVKYEIDDMISDEDNEIESKDKFSKLSISNEKSTRFRTREEVEDYNVSSLRTKLNKLDFYKKTKYVMAHRVGKETRYYVAINKDRHPKTSRDGGSCFFLLHSEFVSTRILKDKSVSSFVHRLRKNKGKWLNMSNEFKLIYHNSALKEDRRKIIRNIGTYQRLRIVNPNDKKKEKVLGIIMMDKKELLADTLTAQDIRERHLTGEVDALRKKNVNNTWVNLTHGKSSDAMTVHYKEDWPKLAFVQGKKNSCLLSSLCSVLVYIKKTKEVNDNYLNEVIDGLNHLKIKVEPQIGNCKLTTVLQYMRQKGFFITKQENKKRRHNGRHESINIFDEKFDFGLFSLLQICGSDSDKNHTIVICNGWIFDSNHGKALPFELKYLDVCCSMEQRRVVFESCTLLYRFKNSKLQPKKRSKKKT